MFIYILVAVFKNKLIVEHKIVDIETDTASDFSIMVTYLPKTATESEIREFFTNQFPGVKIADVSMAFNVEKYMKLEHEKELLHTKLVYMVESSLR